MQHWNQRWIYSANDLCGFWACRTLTQLDLKDDGRAPKAAPDPESQLVMQKGVHHEQRFLEQLQAHGADVVTVPYVEHHSPPQRADESLAVLQRGHQYVYQPFLFNGTFHGYADFLRRVERPSRLGAFSYEPIDTKLGLVEKSSYLVQLLLYAELLAELQGSLPQQIHVVVGNMELKSFTVAEYLEYYRLLKQRFLQAVQARDDQAPHYPEPCEHCPRCHWRMRCAERWQRDDHLSLVANIRRSQRSKLVAAGVTTGAQLAHPSAQRPPTLAQETFLRLQRQAALQRRRQSEPTHCGYEFIVPSGETGGFFLLPKPQNGDLFYDIEGDPLLKEDALRRELLTVRDGLEYLHGVAWREAPDEQPRYQAFWALSKREERRCFEKLIDFFLAHFERFPQARIYHYAGYEVAALRRLATQYSSRTAAVDLLLRGQRFIDLFAIVRQALLIAEPRYSLKNLEHFYRAQRRSSVRQGSSSIVFFEEFLSTGDRSKLDALEEYNREDCISTLELRAWLLNLKDEAAGALGVSWQPTAQAQTPSTAATRSKSAAAAAATEPESDDEPVIPRADEQRLDRYREMFLVERLEGVPVAELTRTEQMRLTCFYLADFYRRELKPQYWLYFERQRREPYELLQDPECIAGVTRVEDVPVQRQARSHLVQYTFEPQETKLRAGRQLFDLRSGSRYGSIDAIDADSCSLRLKISTKLPVHERLALIPVPIDETRFLRQGLDRFLQAVIGAGDAALAGETRDLPYVALLDVLRQAPPAFRNPRPGGVVVGCSAQDPAFLPALREAALDLDRSYLFIQGPPGTGKTYFGAALAVSLLKQGKRIGVVSNSHKAINNFLERVEQCAAEERFSFRGAKKSDREDVDRQHRDGVCIENVYEHADLEDPDFQLVAGTAWVFCREGLDLAFDYLIVDEASQLSLAHLVAAGVAAQNLVLIGDPCQLPQPLQGIHPGKVGLSTLEYLLDGERTVPPQRGVFLETTRRMHPAITSFLSHHVYEGRLTAHPDTAVHAVSLRGAAAAVAAGCTTPTPPPATPPRFMTRESGVLFIPCAHTGNSTSAPEEVQVVEQILTELTGACFTDRSGAKRPLTSADVMVVAPFNLQVQRIASQVGGQARVGTIDLFQGQEAAVVIVSLTTSAIEELARGAEFLFSRERLNVALSRAKALAVVVASPELLRATCPSCEEMALVNTLCAVALAGGYGEE